ncbi:MAG: D-alanyl-D-alanine carboxypeptidase/D-alanyl-D-alanine-endopeptidase [Sumerlaeia bacterium]
MPCKNLQRLTIVFSIGLALSSCARTERTASTSAPQPTGAAELIQLGNRTQNLGGLESALDQLFLGPEYASAHWGVRIETLEGELIYDHQGDKAFMPASQLKVFTTAAALDLLGPDFRYETRVELHGEQQGSTFVGDLVIVGSGDPSLGAWHGKGVQDSSAVLPTWIAALQERGIEKIDGRIIGDGRVFTDEFFNTDWHYGDLPYWYAAGTSGLAMEENAFRCEIIPGKQIGDLATVTWNPNTRYIDVLIETKTVGKDEVSTADSFNFNTEGNTIYFGGQIPIDKIVKERASIWDGPRYAAFLLKEECERQGLMVTGDAVNLRAIQTVDFNRTVSLLLTHQSPPLSELCSVINKVSHNFFADQLVRTLGYKVGKEGSFKEGTRVVRDWLQSREIPNPAVFRMVDGSGLSTGNRFTPVQATTLYRSLFYDSRIGEPFYASLPERKTDTETYAVHAKSGFIGGVRTLGGYLEIAPGETVVFSLMCNLFNGSARDVSNTQDKALEILADELQ